MSRSYRKPYFTWTSAGDSAHRDKITASRGVRRAQNRAVQECEDWDEFLIPHRFECNWNDVWSWGRDGKQREYKLDHNDFNPFYLHAKWCRYRTEEQLIEDTLEDIERKKKFLAELSRK